MRQKPWVRIYALYHSAVESFGAFRVSFATSCKPMLTMHCTTIRITRADGTTFSGCLNCRHTESLMFTIPLTRFATITASPCHEDSRQSLDAVSSAHMQRTFCRYHRQILDEYGFLSPKFSRVQKDALHCGFDPARFAGNSIDSAHSLVCRIWFKGDANHSLRRSN